MKIPKEALRRRKAAQAASLRVEPAKPDPVQRSPLAPRPPDLETLRSAPRRVLNRSHPDPEETLDPKKITDRVVALAQIISEKRFYPPQVALSCRVVESLLNHDGSVVTALFSRQSGKTECIGSICAAIAIIFPALAQQFPNDWHLNITDDQGTYRGFRDGVAIGIYAPKQEQAEIMFDRVRHCMTSKSAKQVLSELGISDAVANGNENVLSNGSSIVCQSASEQSKIEGATHHLLIAEEAQDITDRKMRKSLHPMTASTMGTIVKVGTATGKRCDFYEAGQFNVTEELAGGKRNHFVFPADVCARFNSLYAAYIENEKKRLGVESDEYQMSYMCRWLFERGMFIPTNRLLDPGIAIRTGPGSKVHPMGVDSPHLSVVLGIDWAQMYDSTVVTMLAVNWNNPVTMVGRHPLFRKHVLGWFDMQGSNYEEQFEWLREFLPRIRGLRKIVTDGNTCGAPMVSRLQAFSRHSLDGVSVEGHTFSPTAKSDGYRSLSSDFYSQRLSYPAGEGVRPTPEYKRFIKQFADLQKVHAPGGLMKVSHPNVSGAHDDYCDSLMLAAWGANSPSGLGGAVVEKNVLMARTTRAIEALQL